MFERNIYKWKYLEAKTAISHVEPHAFNIIIGDVFKA